MSVRLFVGNLPYDATEAEIQAHFAPTGAPTRIAIPLDRETGRPRGFAFVDFAEQAAADAAVRKLDSQPFKGRPLAVREARPREERPPGFRPPGAGPGMGPPRSFDSSGGTGVGERGEAPRRTKAAPTRRNKQERGGPKGPIPIRTTGRFYAEEEEAIPEVDVDFDNFATSPPEKDDVATSSPETDEDSGDGQA